MPPGRQRGPGVAGDGWWTGAQDPQGRCPWPSPWVPVAERLPCWCVSDVPQPVPGRRAGPSPPTPPPLGTVPMASLSLPVCIFRGPGPQQPRVRLRPRRGQALTEPLPQPPPILLVPSVRPQCGGSTVLRLGRPPQSRAESRQPLPLGRSLPPPTAPSASQEELQGLLLRMEGGSWPHGSPRCDPLSRPSCEAAVCVAPRARKRGLARPFCSPDILPARSLALQALVSRACCAGGVLVGQGCVSARAQEGVPGTGARHGRVCCF